MEREAAARQDAFDRSVRFEVLGETISLHVGRHMNLAHQAGLESPEGERQLEIVGMLEELRDMLDPANPEGLEMVALALKVADYPATSAA